MWGADREIRPRVTVWHHEALMPNSDLEGRIFLSAPNNHDGFFFLRIFWSPAFNFNAGFAINGSHSYMLTSAIMKIYVVYDVTMTSNPNILTTELRDLLYNQCIDNTRCNSIFIYPTGQIRVCKIRFVSTGENRRKPCLVCKNIWIFHGCEVRIENPSHGITVWHRSSIKQWFFYPHQTTMMDSFSYMPFDLHRGVVINESLSYTLTSAILS